MTLKYKGETADIRVGTTERKGKITGIGYTYNYGEWKFDEELWQKILDILLISSCISF